ncbi:MAG: hypothetical protein OK452_02855 [Thaumarchaeota archaeon]|nr:hypothetical protein [Nitrososphaerota archaeon]
MDSDSKGNDWVRARKLVSAGFVVLLVILSSTYASPAFAQALQNAIGHGSGAQFSSSPLTPSTPQRFGFGFIGIGSLRIAGYSASSFFNGMFLTPPYPSTVQLLMNNGIQEITDQNNINFLLSLMQQANAYPNVKVGLEVAFDITNPSQWTGFTNTMTTLHSSPYSSSIGFVGFAVEQLNIVDNGATGSTVDNAFAQAKGVITANGWQFVSYYPQGWQGTNSGSNNYQFTAHTNYPTGDTQANLNDGSGSSNIVGQTIGSDGLQPYPSIGCSTVYGYNEPAWSTLSFAEGYLGTGYNNIGPCHNPVTNAGYPPTVNQAVAAAASVSAFNRQWVYLLGGNTANGYGALSSCGCSYTYQSGASGVSSHFMWDYLPFRATVSGWIAANPGVFLTSTGAQPPTTSTSSTTTSTSPTTTTSTSTSSSSSTSATSTTSSSSTSASSTTTSSSSTSTTSSPTSSTTSTTTSTQSSTATSTSTSVTTTTTTIVTTTTITSVSQPSLALGLSPSIGSVVQGGVVTVNLAAFMHGTNQMGVLSAPNLAPGFTVSFSPTQSISSFSSTMQVQVSSAVSTGTYFVIVSLTSGGISAAVTYTLYVSAAPMQYYLLLESLPSSGGTTIPAPGRYLSAPNSSFSATASPMAGYTLDHWTLDGQSVGSSTVITATIRHNNSALAAIFRPLSAGSLALAEVTFWSLEGSHTIQVDGSSYTLPTVFSWPVGSNHSITATSSTSDQTRWVFQRWSGSIKSSSPQATLKVSSSMDVIAEYQTQVLLQLRFTDSAGAPIRPDSASLYGPSGSVDVPASGQVWIVEGARYTLQSVFYMGIDVGPGGQSSVIPSTTPTTRTIPLLVYDVTTKITDMFGMPLQGALVSITTANGQVLASRSDSAGLASFTHVPLGTYTAHVSYMGLTYDVAQSSAGSNTLAVAVALSYPMLALVALLGSGASLYLLRGFLNRRKLESQW